MSAHNTADRATHFGTQYICANVITTDRSAFRHALGTTIE
jgi:hypothetical protein